MTVGEVVQRLLRAWGSGAWRDLSPPEAVHEAATLRLCCDKAASCLGWRNALSLDEAIEMTAAWYNTFYSGVSQDAAYHRCTRQIVEYIEKAREKKLKWAAEKTET